jgi:hypothetical protein
VVRRGRLSRVVTRPRVVATIVLAPRRTRRPPWLFVIPIARSPKGARGVLSNMTSLSSGCVNMRRLKKYSEQPNPGYPGRLMQRVYRRQKPDHAPGPAAEARTGYRHASDLAKVARVSVCRANRASTLTVMVMKQFPG